MRNRLKEPTAAPIVIGHRGASSTAPENTLPAVNAAWECGASWIEIDVQPTIDNVPVIIHDDTVDRTTNGTGAVREMTSTEIAALDAGSWFGNDSDGKGSFTGAGIPTLRDVIATLDGDRRILLEIKGEHTLEQVGEIMEVVRRSGREKQVLLQSFEIDVLRHIRTLDPDREVGLLVEALDADPVSICQELGAVLYNPRQTTLRGHADVVGALHAAGIGLYPWTADLTDDWQYLTEIGVDGIITNRPAELFAWQANRESLGG